MNYFKQNHFISKLILGGLTVLLVLFLNIGNLFSSPFLYKFKDFKYPFSNYLISKKKENNTKFFIKSKHIEITNAYVKIPIGNLSTTAAYMTITSEINDKIIKLSSPIAKKVEIHKTSVDKNGIIKMRKLKYIPISKSKPLILKPEGLHFMIMGLKKTLVESETFPLSIYLNSGLIINLELNTLLYNSNKEMKHQH
ncbi:MAG: hypothetical protein CMM49_07495 [Rhodospirillaceae bacterium]|nr:hypothetical protein [Rhodospirillaceae bacterium]|tara:strand:- start:975 stop:1562 length:588 start_codon:yes stop_codon:yes gene_type:complete